MNCINRRGGISHILSWAVAVGLAAGSAGCMENSAGAESAATETAKFDRHFVREGRELREVRVAEANPAEAANAHRHFRREGRELRELPVSTAVETAKPAWAQRSESQNRGTLEVSSTVEAHDGR
ncbi:MAG TPA: hypothetical protein VEK07_17350 [Polyangiaceae bacterium]|nr:hypothetical protein [Polyangiaceae bacterium]